MSIESKIFFLCCMMALLQQQCFSGKNHYYISRYTFVLLPKLNNTEDVQSLDFEWNTTTIHLTLQFRRRVMSINTNITLVRRNGTTQLDASRFLPKPQCTGTVEGYPDSFVSGTIDDDWVFDGLFTIDDAEYYYIEPLSKYFPNYNHSHNALVYASADLRVRTGADYGGATKPSYQKDSGATKKHHHRDGSTAESLHHRNSGATKRQHHRDSNITKILHRRNDGNAEQHHHRDGSITKHHHHSDNCFTTPLDNEKSDVTKPHHRNDSITKKILHRRDSGATKEHHRRDHDTNLRRYKDGVGVIAPKSYEMAVQRSWLRRTSLVPRPKNRYQSRNFTGDRPALIMTYVCPLRIVADYRVYEFVSNRSVNNVIERINVMLQTADNALRKSKIFNNSTFRVGLFAKTFEVYLEPLNIMWVDVAKWSFRKFFEEFRVYMPKQSDVCAGLLFTFRLLEASSEKFGPSQLPINWRQRYYGTCSADTEPAPLSPESTHYADFFTYALPVNFYYRRKVATHKHMGVQIIHQVGHLLGTKEASANPECDEKNPEYMYISAFPLNPGASGTNLRFSECDIRDMKTHLITDEQRKCFELCMDPGCKLPLGLPTTPNFNITIWSTPKPTNRVCWTETVDTGVRSSQSRKTISLSFKIFLCYFLIYLWSFDF